MNMRNINVITARVVPDKNVSDDFMHAVLSNCTTKIVLLAPKVFSSESLPHNFNMAAVGVMKKEFRNIRNPSMNKLVSDGSGSNKKGKINLFSGAITLSRRNKYGI
ncbi:conjugal transfer protein TrbD [Escherichia coli]|uniref:conjugal transfer protein TrbD n=1 Tax=Escherichia coli TaxID=562 RepID=UPI0025420ADA|nr:conjugal transfer protein TrbD [Escherichia coli]